jgi:hypothetical protein
LEEDDGDDTGKMDDHGSVKEYLRIFKKGGMIVVMMIYVGKMGTG